MSQKIENIDIADLILWTENPRDPINLDATDQDIADKAWKDQHEKWNLQKLAKEMRARYDLSELPTVVYHNEKPVVYDGNRRMILAKIKHNCVHLEGFDKSKLPEIPQKIPCNVCSKDIAVENVFRKHGDSGSWSPLDRDLFIHKFLGEPKSIFLKFDESTGLISSNQNLNKVFVKNEIFTSEKLKELGFEFLEDDLQSRHSDEEAKLILNDISEKISSKQINTRTNRGNVIGVLEKGNRSLIEKNSKNTPKNLNISNIPDPGQKTVKRQAARTRKKTPEFFDGVLYLKAGQISDLYRDITDLYSHYQQKKNLLSQYFPSIIRMSLRLLVEAAASDVNKTFDDYLKSNFAKAKLALDSDSKTTLFTQNVTDTTIVQLLHIGAHKYDAANNLEQTIAISIILGKILTITHGS